MIMAMARRPSSRVLAILLFGAYGTGCMRPWRFQENDPQAFIESEQPKKIRVWRSDGSTILVEDPAIKGDSLTGVSREQHLLGDVIRLESIPLHDISAVETRGVDGGRTALAVLGVGMLVAVVAAAAAYDPPERPVRSTGDITSCPFVYSWDGERWRLDSGTFGGAITRGASRTDVDNLVYAMPSEDILRLRLANELNETDYVDALTVVAVDHPLGVSVAPDGDGGLHTIGTPTPPARAVDYRGRDVLPRVAALDGMSWESSIADRDTSIIADVRDGLELAFPRPAGATHARLVLDGHDTGWAAMMLSEWIRAHGTATQAWYDSLDTQPTMRRQVLGIMAETGFLRVSVRVGDRWEPRGYIPGASPELIKRQVMALDLSSVQGDTVRVRLESAPSFWRIDFAGLDFTPPQPTEVHELRASVALSQTGNDLRTVLGAIDGAEYVMETGDYADMEFVVPPVTPGMSRSYLVRSTGWYRIHTPDTEPPQIALLERLERDPTAASREAVGRMNDLLQVLGRTTR